MAAQGVRRSLRRRAWWRQCGHGAVAGPRPWRRLWQFMANALWPVCGGPSRQRAGQARNGPIAAQRGLRATFSRTFSDGMLVETRLLRMTSVLVAVALLGGLVLATVPHAGQRPAPLRPQQAQNETQDPRACRQHAVSLVCFWNRLRRLYAAEILAQQLVDRRMLGRQQGPLHKEGLAGHCKKLAQ